MHFSKTYTQLLLELPPDLRANAIQYRELKKVINQIVDELSALGLNPALLHELIGPPPPPTEGSPSLPPPFRGPGPLDSNSSHSNAEGLLAQGIAPEGTNVRLGPRTRVVYELNAASGRVEPQLRISMAMLPPMPENEGSPNPSGDTAGSSESNAEGLPELDTSHTSLLWAFQQMHFEGGAGAGGAVGDLPEVFKSGPTGNEAAPPSMVDTDAIYSPGVAEVLQSAASIDPASMGSPSFSSAQEIVIPLVHDSKFYNLLSTTLEAISERLGVIHTDFVHSLEDLSRAIADTAHPASVAANFHPPSSLTTHAGTVRVRTGELKNDLYAWREIFQIYLEAEVFERVGEVGRGERSVEECERQLQLFAQRVTRTGIPGGRRQFKLKQSVQALETFLSLNLFILNIKKFSHANSEATRKILKKHAKRTALFFPGLSPGTTAPSSAPQTLQALATRVHPLSLPHLLVQALGETLLPIVPSVEDYACLICTALAFKPVRLRCGHLFCVRCLVKMQKRREERCPMCRAPSVLVANGTNVDWGLLNFMQDWFPIEAREKLKANEREASEEELRELGIDPNQPCVVM